MDKELRKNAESISCIIDDLIEKIIELESKVEDLESELQDKDEANTVLYREICDLKNN